MRGEDRRQTIIAYANNANKRVLKSAVRSVKFTGGSEDDTIFLASDLSVPASVKGGDGLRVAEFTNLRQLVDQVLGR